MSLVQSRRQFVSTVVKLGGIAGGGLALGFHLPAAAARQSVAIPAPAALLNAYVQIRSDGAIIIAAQNPEVGQGVKTSLPMIVAEELDANWADVSVVQSSINAELYGPQMAGGSRSIPSRWDALRQAGANARAVLVQAAAEEWQVDPAECSTKDSMVIHEASGKKLSYAKLADKAAGIELPKKVELKSRDQYRLLGTRVSGVDNSAIVRGEPLFGIDQRVDNMQYAVYVKNPARVGKLVSSNIEEVKALPGITAAFELEGNNDLTQLAPGVAIVGRSTWAVFSARKKLQLEWDTSETANESWTQFQQQARQLAKQKGEMLTQQGDLSKTFDAADKTLQAFYSYPFVAHAPMEPQNCTARATDKHCELWAPTQTPQSAVASVAKLLGLSDEAIILNQTRMGGGFGRRLETDFCCEAAAISQRVGTAVKLQWTREDDMAHDFYRVGGFHSLQASLDDKGELSGLRDHFISFSPDGKKPARGGQMLTSEFPLSKLEHGELQQSLIKSTTPTGWWRAPMSCSVAFAMQSFIHEIAVAANKDHAEFLISLLEKEDIHPKLVRFDGKRAAGTVREVVKRAGWNGKLSKGHHHGLAFYYSHAGYFAHVAEVSVSDDKKLRLHKMTVVGDVGPIINLSGAENQVQGSVIDGFSTAMGLQVNIEQGRATESNYHQYPLLRMNSTPEIDVHFIASEHSPTGLGEPALPPTAPAIANAMFAATGERVREMPFTKSGYRLA